MEQSRIEESVSVSSSSVDISVLFPMSLGLTLFFLSLSPHTRVICLPYIPPLPFLFLRGRSTSREMAWVDGLLQRKSLLIRPCFEMGV